MSYWLFKNNRLTYREQNERYEKMMRETLEEQRKSDKEERERDREFFMQLGKEVNNMPIFFQKTY